MKLNKKIYSILFILEVILVLPISIVFGIIKHVFIPIGKDLFNIKKEIDNAYEFYLRKKGGKK